MSTFIEYGQFLHNTCSGLQPREPFTAGYIHVQGLVTRRYYWKPEVAQ